MDEKDFEMAIAAALIGSGRIRRDNFNTYDIGRLVDVCSHIAKKAWQVQSADKDPSGFVLLIYAALLGSKGCNIALDDESYVSLWDEAHRLENIARRVGWSQQ